MKVKQNSESPETVGKARKIVTALIVLVVLVDIVELLKKLHGG